ncbi:MAG: ABC transporter permease, partial [Firmicutes bacterium]|nr:ABC transporter permease [Bacillota bacterium]
MNKLADSLQKNKSYLTSLVLSIGAALLIGAILMLVTGYNPLEGYAAMLKGVFGSSRVFGNTLAKMLTLCLTGLAMAVCSKAGMFNVGGEGQLFLGGLAATMTGVYLQGVSPVIAVPLAFLSAAAVGGFYAWIPAILKVKLNVSEVITTIMLNSVAIYFCSYLT